MPPSIWTISRNGPSFIDPAYLFGEAAVVLYGIGDLDGSNDFAARSLDDARRQGRARRASLTTAVIAKNLIARSEPDEAAAEAQKVIEYAAGVNSSRSRNAVREF